MPDTHKTPRKIIGISLSPKLAASVKEESKRRGISLKKLFEEMWALYQMKQK